MLLPEPKTFGEQSLLVPNPELHSLLTFTTYSTFTNSTLITHLLSIVPGTLVTYGGAHPMSLSSGLSISKDLIEQ